MNGRGKRDRGRENEWKKIVPHDYWFGAECNEHREMKEEREREIHKGNQWTKIIPND